VKQQLEQHASIKQFSEDVFSAIGIGAKDDKAQKAAVNTARTISKTLTEQLGNQQKKDGLINLFGEDGVASLEKVNNVFKTGNFKEIQKAVSEFDKDIKTMGDNAQEAAEKLGIKQPTIDTYANAGTQMGKMEANTFRAVAGLETLKNKLDEISTKSVHNFANSLINVGNALMKVSMLINGIKNLGSA
jgi:hypothetical protein